MTTTVLRQPLSKIQMKKKIKYWMLDFHWNTDNRELLKSMRFYKNLNVNVTKAKAKHTAAGTSALNVFI